MRGPSNPLHTRCGHATRAGRGAWRSSWAHAWMPMPEGNKMLRTQNHVRSITEQQPPAQAAWCQRCAPHGGGQGPRVHAHATPQQPPTCSTKQSMESPSSIPSCRGPHSRDNTCRGGPALDRSRSAVHEASGAWPCGPTHVLRCRVGVDALAVEQEPHAGGLQALFLAVCIDDLGSQAGAGKTERRVIIRSSVSSPLMATD